MYALSIEDILLQATQHQASDIHLVSGINPMFRINGLMTRTDLEPIKQEDMKKLLYDMLTEEQIGMFESEKELDFSFSRLEGYQFRANLHMTKGEMAITIRITPIEIKSAEEMMLPSIVPKLCSRHKGLIIISGTANSGKSTTLTYIINMINRTRACKVITIEDPIEYYHQNEKSLIIQREVGADTRNFASALKYALRQDPDVVAVGEMRDLESVSMALTTAETGHLVLTTVHAADAIETINRIIDVYPIGYRDQICAQLAGNLIGVISQTLLPHKESARRVLATEVLLSTVAIQNIIRRGTLNELRGQLDAEPETGMHSMENDLSHLVDRGIITKDTAYQHTRNPHLLEFADEKGDKNKEKKRRFITEDQATEANLASKKICIINSESLDRKEISDALASNGFTNCKATDPDRYSYEMVVKEMPDMVIINIDSIGFAEDSFALCKQIKENNDLPAKVIMMTDNLKRDTSDLVYGAGADAFVLKTKDYDLLIKKIKDFYEVT